jgi:hypothetical protein
MLVVPKTVGFSIPIYEPETRTLDSLGTKQNVAPSTILVIPRGQGESTTHLWREIEMDPDGCLYREGAGKVRHDLKHNTRTPAPDNEKSNDRYPLLTQLYFSTIISDDVIQRWALCCKSLFQFIFGKDTCAWHIVICVYVYINKFEIPFHFCSHSFRVTRKLLPDVFSEGSTSPTSHFLNLCVGIAREGQCIDEFDGYTPCLRILQKCCCHLRMSSPITSHLFPLW